MKIKVICVGQKMPAWVNSAVAEYSKRYNGLLDLQFVAVAMAKRHKNDSASDIEKHCNNEGAAILHHCKPNDTLIALEVGGKNLSTEGLATQIQHWQLQGNDVVLAVGGPDGHSQGLKQRASWHWSLSKLTLPHPMVRVILAEQLYRAATIIAGHPYHRQ